jgi:hypothetical protein
MGILVFFGNQDHITGEPREWRQKYEEYGKALILSPPLTNVKTQKVWA